MKPMNSDTIEVYGKTFEKFISYQAISTRVKDVCDTLNEKYVDSCPLFLGILNGAFMFSAEVMRHMNIDCEITFVKLKSYIGDQSSGDVVKMLGLECSLKDRDVIILEDIVDTGRTLHHFMPQIEAEQPKSVSLFALLVKPDAMQFELAITYAGFAVPNHFLVGFGLDYDGRGRNINDIYKAV